jgi:hypothetical protein
LGGGEGGLIQLNPTQSTNHKMNNRNHTHPQAQTYLGVLDGAELAPLGLVHADGVEEGGELVAVLGPVDVGGGRAQDVGALCWFFGLFGGFVGFGGVGLGGKWIVKTWCLAGWWAKAKLGTDSLRNQTTRGEGGKRRASLFLPTLPPTCTRHAPAGRGGWPGCWRSARRPRR